MMLWCKIQSGTLFSVVDEKGNVLGIHSYLEKHKKEKTKF
jgi:hypothetical protein